MEEGQFNSDRQYRKNASHNKTGSGYNKTWSIIGIDCPGCIKKIRKALENESKITHASVSFATHKLSVGYAPGIREKEGDLLVATLLEKLGFGLENNEKTPPKRFGLTKHLFEVIHFCGMTLLFILAMSVWKHFPLAAKVIFSIATLWGIYPVILKAYRQAKTGLWFGIETLMSLACLGALFLGEYPEAVLLLMLFRIGVYLESLACSKAKKGVESLMSLIPEKALLIVDGKQKEVMASYLAPGDHIILRAGDRLPVDGVLLESATLDTSFLTGESMPVSKAQGESVMAGTLVTEQNIRVKVISEPGNNAVDRILQLIENAESHKAPVERFINRFSRYYTPLMIAVAFLTMLIPPLFFQLSWHEWIYRGLAVLLIACPCALVISTPAAITSALARASRMGALIKGGSVIECLASIKTVAFDKTGTLSKGSIEVVDCLVIDEKNEWLKLAASIEQGSSHPLAMAIVNAAKKHGISLMQPDTVTAFPGKGIKGHVKGQEVAIFSTHYLNEYSNAILLSDMALEWTKAQCEKGRTVIAVCINMKLCALLSLADSLRDDATIAIQRLARSGIKSIMLSGDNRRSARTVAEKLDIDFYAELLPEDKVSMLHKTGIKGPVAMVGDGINDAPALKSAHVGIAMGKGSDTALEVADVALTHEKLVVLADVIQLAKKTRNIIFQNVGWALGLKLIVLFTTVFGLTGLLIAVLSDAGATVLVTANSLRLLKKHKASKSCGFRSEDNGNK